MYIDIEVLTPVLCIVRYRASHRPPRPLESSDLTILTVYEGEYSFNALLNEGAASIIGETLTKSSDIHGIETTCSWWLCIAYILHIPGRAVVYTQINLEKDSCR